MYCLQRTMLIGSLLVVSQEDHFSWSVFSSHHCLLPLPILTGEISPAVTYNLTGYLPSLLTDIKAVNEGWCFGLVFQCHREFQICSCVLFNLYSGTDHKQSGDEMKQNHIPRTKSVTRLAVVVPSITFTFTIGYVTKVTKKQIIAKL